MWKFNPFGGKEHGGLDGRTIDVGNVKITVRNAIAEGGFSCVYAARDAVHPSKQYALKHMICNDSESLDLVMKEIQVMKIFKGHPNIVNLVAQSVFDMGRTKEAILVMEFCEKSLVGLLESRGAAYFDEKQILVIFRDVCNAVFAMHGQSPPIAHRDLKAENVLLGSDGVWKLCDFGSTSTKHKCFDKPEEMGVEEDNIRKHTTPAYRAPEMWDLYRKEVINEKVDIWALGCLLFRLCYLKPAFDGESKLQILNGNYRIPELPKYSSALTGLIKDMLEGSPDARPDITQVWCRVNGQLPKELQRNSPDGAPFSIGTHASSLHEEGANRRTPVMPQRSPPAPPGREQVRNTSSASSHDAQNAKGSKATDAPMGAFWSTQYAQDSQVVAERKGPLFDEEPAKPAAKQNPTRADSRDAISRLRAGNAGESAGNSAQGNSRPKNGRGNDIKHAEPQNDAVRTFVADFDSAALQPGNSPSVDTSRRKGLEAEVVSLKEQLKKTNEEKAEITSKYEKLSAICRTQRQEIQELKRAVADTASSTSTNTSSRNPERRNEKIEGTVWELEQGLFAASSPAPSSQQWQAFPDSSSHQGNHTANGQQQLLPNQPRTGFSAEKGTQISRSSAQGSSSQRFASSSAAKKAETPSGWAGF